MHSPDLEPKQDDPELASTEDAELHGPQDKTEQIAPPPPDGGYGWVCTISCATINAHTWGE